MGLNIDPTHALAAQYAVFLCIYLWTFVNGYLHGYTRSRCFCLLVVSAVCLWQAFLLDIAIGIGFGAGATIAWALYLAWGPEAT